MMTSEAFFRAYLQDYQPFKSYWNYEDGCLLLGCQRMYEATGASLYAEFVLQYLSQRVADDGSIAGYLTEQHCLDSFHCSRALFFAERMTHDPRYRKAIHWQVSQLAAHPRTESGLCWHKGIYPHQVWIDGIYMAAPFLVEYANHAQDDSIYPELRHWFTYVRTHLLDAETGLYHHAIDETKTQCWADAETGCSKVHWLRAEGWYLMALCDTLALLPQSQRAFAAELASELRAAAEHLAAYRTENGLLCQVIDQPELDGNYTETSGSLMAAYAFLRGAALHVLPLRYRQIGLQMLRTVRSEKLIDGRLTDICSAAGLGGSTNRDGSAAYYLSEPVAANDPKGVGALMSAEAECCKGLRQIREKLVRCEVV